MQMLVGSMCQRFGRIRQTFVANLRKRSEVTWPAFLAEMVVFVCLYAIFAGVLFALGWGSGLAYLTVACASCILGYTALRLVLRAVFRRGRRQG
ncbi:hypothetical protein VAB18032_14930 [Micromonospora maris AB-18-032]|nr:hypothetical protein VAB18032_14930 [Micromonospora maris AB-18-032]